MKRILFTLLSLLTFSSGLIMGDAVRACGEILNQADILASIPEIDGDDGPLPDWTPILSDWHISTELELQPATYKFSTNQTALPRSIHGVLPPVRAPPLDLRKTL